METWPARLTPLQRWSAYAGLWLLTCSIFGTQLYLAGYVTPWARAVATEAVYWLSWWLLAPAIFWWCRRLRGASPTWRVVGLAAGALAAVFAAPLIAQIIATAQSSLHLCVGDCVIPTGMFSGSWLMLAVRIAALNLTVYTGIVLGWHAVTFYREARDRQMRAVELESLLREAQLEALRSQLNPHFLFNSLHSIAELVHQNPKLAEQLIVRLGELLRQVLETAKQPELTLGAELEFIRGYLDIEQMRFPKLSARFEVPEELGEVRVPSLILQPLIENALKHGVNSNQKPTLLTVRAFKQAGNLAVEVVDDGPGASTQSGTGVGLANVRERLASRYGASASLDCESRPGKGFIARVVMPLES